MTCFSTPLDQAQIDFENEGGETYICGNPPYLGFNLADVLSKRPSSRAILEGTNDLAEVLDYVAGWFMKAAEYGTQTHAVAAFVATNSICQGTVGINTVARPVSQARPSSVIVQP